MNDSLLYLEEENERAENSIKEYAKYYHSRENDCPVSFKFLMLLNEWHSPFVAINELLKRVYSNEQILKKNKVKYKKRYKDLQFFVQEIVNERVS